MGVRKKILGVRSHGGYSSLCVCGHDAVNQHKRARRATWDEELSKLPRVVSSVSTHLDTRQDFGSQGSCLRWLPMLSKSGFGCSPKNVYISREEIRVQM